MAEIQTIDGSAIAAKVRSEVAGAVKAHVEKGGATPGLGVVLVGERADSSAYVRGKERACEEVGIFTETRRLPASASQGEILGVVGEMNRAVRAMALAGLHQRYPHDGPAMIRRRLADLVLGAELAACAYGPLLEED